MASFKYRWLLLVVLLSLPVMTHAQENSVDPRFGVIEAYHEPEIADELEVGWERILFYWSELEREGPDDWNEFHAPLSIIEQEVAEGREVVGLLTHTPAWATDGSEGAGVPRGLYLPPDDPKNLWANFVRETLTYYDGLINRWIIWNEPDIDLETYGAQWQGSTADYYQLVKTAYIVAHEVNPDVKIHLGGLTYWHYPTYLREYLSVVAQDPTAPENDFYFDVVSVHIYFKPETTIQILDALRVMLNEHGLEDKSIWINETNAPPYDDPSQLWENPVFNVTQEMQAAFLLQEFALALALDVERIAVYKLVDEPPLQPGFEPYGLLRQDRTKRPAFEAFDVITTHYSHVNDGRYIETPEAFTIILNRGERTTRVFWARRPYMTMIITPAIGKSALHVQQTGVSRTIKPVVGNYILFLKPSPCVAGQTCLMGGPPIVLVEDSEVNLEQYTDHLIVDFTPRLVGAVIAVGIVLGGVGIFMVRYRRSKIVLM